MAALGPHTVSSLVGLLNSSHNSLVLGLAVMHHFTTSLLDHYGREHGVSLESHITMLDKAIACYRDRSGISKDEWIAAKTNLALAARLVGQKQSL